MKKPIQTNKISLTVLAGRFCECNLNEGQRKETTHEDKCIKLGSLVCEGHGNCFCGNCKCDSDYVGKYCQHKISMHCSSADGKECSGKFLRP